MPNHNSEHHIPFNLFLFILVILCVSFSVILFDELNLRPDVPTVVAPVTDITTEVLVPSLPTSLMSKVNNSQLFYAYKVAQQDGLASLPNEPFAIGTDMGDIQVVSNYPGWTSADALFDFAGDNLLVVNSQNNSIDIFNILGNKFFYDRSLTLPQYEIGQLFGIKCNEDSLCTLNTAVQFESGCSLSLDLTTDEFSEPLCGTGYNEFFTTYIPELK